MAGDIWEELFMKLYNGDCLEVLRTLPDACVDLVVTDPPYSQSVSGAGIFKDRTVYSDIKSISNGYDPEILNELDRVMKSTNIYVFCSKNEIPAYLDYYVKDRGNNYDLLTWHKTNPVPACNNTYLSDTEYLLFFRAPGVPVYGTPETKAKYWVTATNKAEKKRFAHPTIKPQFIIETLITNSSIRGGCVLDPFMGSGTTGAACKATGRDFIGIELDRQWFETAEKRINEQGENVPEIAEQLKLF